MQNIPRPSKQKGMALIVAIMIVALVTVLSVEIYWNFNLATSRHGSRTFGVQGRAYLDALEDFARQILKTDMEENEFDHLGEIWAAQQPPFDTDLGYVGGRIEDAQGRLNINNLQSKVENPKGGFANDWYKRYTTHQRRFIRLLQTLEIEEGVLCDQPTAEGITEALIDWLDPDSEPTGFGGAEGDHYSRMEPPLTIGNREMTSISELSLVKGVTPRLYESLLPLLVALPTDVPMNINTMPGALLRVLNTKNDPLPLSVEDAQELINARGLDGLDGFETLQDFLGHGGVKSVLGLDRTSEKANSPNGFDTDGLGVQSSFFIFIGEAMVAEHMQYSKSMLMRTDKDVVTIRRTDANF